MLSHLSIRDIVLIERLDIDFAAGLSVLTGETGAGKSILLDALSLALGARGDVALVRHGAAQGQVTAAFDVPRNHPARTILSDNAIDDDGDIILKRVQAADGRTRVFVNDQPASVSLMREIGRALVEIHGQHDERAMVEPAAHRQLLDAFGGHVGAADSVAESWKRWRGADQDLARHRAKVEAAAREAEYLRASAAELSRLDPQPGEETELSEQRAAMMRAEKIASDISDAQEVLSGPASPIPQLASLLRRLQRKAAEAPGLLDEIIRAIDGGLISLDAAQSAVEAAMRASEFDPQLLEKTEERLFSLRAASRKFAVPVDDLAQLRDSMLADLADLDAGAERLKLLEKQAAGARDHYDREAGAPVGASRRRRGRADARGDGGTAGAEARTRRIHRRPVERTAEPHAGGHRPCRVPGAHQSGDAAGAVDEGRVGRRAVAFPAGAQGGAGRSRLGADAGLRRDRHRRRRLGRRRDRAATGAAGRAGAGAVGHACAAGRGARGNPLSDFQDAAAPTASRPALPKWIAARGRRKSPACWPARRSPTKRAPLQNDCCARTRPSVEAQESCRVLHPMRLSAHGSTLIPEPAYAFQFADASIED